MQQHHFELDADPQVQWEMGCCGPQLALNNMIQSLSGDGTSESQRILFPFVRFPLSFNLSSFIPIPSKKIIMRGKLYFQLKSLRFIGALVTQ